MVCFAAIFCLVTGLATSDSAIAQQKSRVNAKVEIITMPDKSARSYFERKASNSGPEIETVQKKELVDKCCKIVSNTLQPIPLLELQYFRNIRRRIPYSRKQGIKI